MASLALQMKITQPSWLTLARERQPALTNYALLLLALTVPVLIGTLVDPRTIDGTNVWIKPAKFLVSVAIYSLTIAWFFECVRPERRTSRTMRALVSTVIGAGSLEIAYIAVQGARALPSHFNRSSTTYEVLYAAMGIAAVLLIGTAAVLAWEIVRRPAHGVLSDYLAAVVTGLVVCFVLGGGVGMYMAQQTGHSVGVTGGQVPLFGWNRSGGDLRIAHFLGIHAQQAIPLMAIALARLRPRLRVAALTLGTTVYVGSTIAIFVQALQGRALVPM